MYSTRLSNTTLKITQQRDKVINVNVKRCRCPCSLLVWNGISIVFNDCFQSVSRRTSKILKCWHRNWFLCFSEMVLQRLQWLRLGVGINGCCGWRHCDWARINHVSNEWLWCSAHKIALNFPKYRDRIRHQEISDVCEAIASNAEAQD